MKQLFLMVNDGSVKLIDTPKPQIKDGYVLVETLYSAVSAGTERGLTNFGGKNLVQKALERPDQVQKVLEKVSTDGLLTTLDAAFNKLNEPMPMGYSAVGKILECGRGVTELRKGDMVAMAGQAYHSEINRVNHNLVAKVPEEVTDIKQVALCALGGIALEGIHQAKVMPGECIGVVGMGLLGNILARILHAYGCDVIGYDIEDKRLPKTLLKEFIKSSDENAAELTKGLTKGRGVDKVIITASTDSNGPMDLAAAIARDRAIICMIGVTKMDIDRRPYYAKELTFTIARSYGPGRYDTNYEEKGVDYPIGYVRFTEGRNIEEFLRLLATGRLDVSDLITHIFPFDEAEKAYELITKNPNRESYIGVLLQYSENVDKMASIVKIRKGAVETKGTIGVGLIGAGNFAKTTILPVMSEFKEYEFVGLATTGGINAAQASDNHKFHYLTNDYRKLLEDRNIDLIIVSTGHNTHAKFVVEALQAGKNVYCEKPLCLTLDELDAIEEAYKNSKGELFCGLNRRHAPLIKKIRHDLSTDKIPAVYTYIANAGYIPEEHWVQDEAVGGGRIIGEACHFLDTLLYLDGSNIKNVIVTFAQNDAYPCKDNCNISVSFTSGAIGNIVYTSMGSKKFPKEKLMVFSNGIVCCLDNYISLDEYGNNKKHTFKLKQDKGIGNEYKYIAEVLKGKRKNKTIQDAFDESRFLIQACKENGKHDK